jgi:hypothetical protein
MLTLIISRLEMKIGAQAILITGERINMTSLFKVKKLSLITPTEIFHNLNRFCR